MSLARLILATLLLVIWCGCSSGGSSGPATQLDQWPKFRHDLSNTGNQSSGSVGSIATIFKAVQVDVGEPSAISASPAITFDGSVYVGSEGGTLLATDASLNVKWRVTRCVPPPPPATPVPASCDLCPGPGLGPLVSSPAVYTQMRTNVTTILVASKSGCVFGFQDNGTSASCVACFRPLDDASITAASFVSSPTFTVQPVTLDLTGVFIGATIERQAAKQGKLYAINSDGSLKWEFPRVGSDHPATIGPVTSSPAFGTGGIFFTADGDSLYALTSDGALRWQSDMRFPTDLSLVFALSPLATASYIYVPTTGGEIVALQPDGSASWQTFIPNEVFAGSLAIGNQGVVSPTPAPGATPAPTPAPIGPTPTLTPLLTESTLFGVTKSGVLVVADALTGRLMPPSGPLPTPVSGSVVSSPALSADVYLVFATGNGMLYSVSTATGIGPPNWPITLTAGAAIRSSPAISFNGTIFVGADDGKLYAVGIQ